MMNKEDLKKGMVFWYMNWRTRGQNRFENREWLLSIREIKGDTVIFSRIENGKMVNLANKVLIEEFLRGINSEERMYELAEDFVYYE